jgi:hypothetical protein
LSEKSFNIVVHNIFGEGSILETRWDGAESRVKFRSGLCLWLPTKWLRQLHIEEKELDRISSKRMLEAFRMGVVPHQDIEYFTFGRASEIDTFQTALTNLKNGSGGVFLVEGGYGTGKTHLLEYLHHLSLRSGLVTAYCELHVHETPPYRPKKIYHDIAYSLRFIKEGCEYSYRDLLKEACGIELPDHCFYTPVLRKIREMDNGGLHSEVFWQWIEGESTKEYAIDPVSPYRVRGGQSIPALYDFSTAADFYNFLLSGLSYMVNALGLGGMVIIIDEFEEINHVWENHLKERGYTFWEGMIRVALNDEDLRKLDCPLPHNQVRPTPYLYRDSHILLVIATTPTDDIRAVSRIQNRVVLRRFSRVEFEIIFDNLLRVYKCAYQDFHVEKKMCDNILNSAMKRNREELREFIKFCVEAFDWLRLGVRS